MLKGQPDLLILERGVNGEPGLAIEFKTGTNTLSPEQTEWFEKMRARGWRCAEVRSTIEFHAVLTAHVGWSTMPPVGAAFVDLE